MSRNDKCFCGSGKKRKKCHSNIMEDSYMEHLLKRYYEIEKQVSDYKANNEQFNNHPCQKGCFNCCSDIFTISILEFELILDDIRNYGKDYAENIYSNALKNLEILKEENPELYKRLEEDVTLSDYNKTNRLDANKYIKSERFPFLCPLIDQTKGTCMVYDKRPMICRIHGTTHNLLQLMSESFKICEYIESHSNALETPEINTYESDTNSMLISTFNGHDFVPRKYPIIYWFKIYQNKNIKKGKEIYSSLVPSLFYKKMGTLTMTEIMP